jgi:tetratricopeptide (TPR) repeat protein
MEGMQAFREAVLLYPASPEATFRYVQECLIPFNRWDIILELLDYTDLIDPNNHRTQNIRKYVTQMREMIGVAMQLEAKRRANNGKLEPQESLILARAYFTMGRVMEAAQLVRLLVDTVNEPAALQAIATLLVAAHLDEDAEKCLTKYLKLEPKSDYLSWLDLAKIQHRAGRKTAAQQSFIKAYQINNKEVWALLRTDQDLIEIATPLFQRK